MAKHPYPLISSKAVIGKVIRDVQPNYDSWQGNAIEWIGEAMQKIGTFAGFEDKVYELNVSSYKASIPCDLIDYDSLWLNGKRLVKLASRNAGGEVPGGQSSYEEDSVYFPQEGYLASGDGYFRFNFESTDEGNPVILKGKGYPLDKDGLPMVPNTTDYLQALADYVLYRMMFSGFKHLDLNWREQKDIWRRSMRVARTITFPHIDDMERFRRWWGNMVPRDYSWGDDFSDFTGEYVTTD